jgi:hypothetical protein
MVSWLLKGYEVTGYWNNNEKLGELIFAVLNGTADDAQHAELEAWLTEDAEAMRYYAELVTIYSSLRLSGDIYTLRPSSEIAVELGTDDMLWHALAETEKTATGIEIEKSVPETTYETGIAGKRKEYNGQRQISRLSLYTAICSTAALLLILAYVWMNPKTPALRVVATLSEVTGARWAQPSEDLVEGAELYPGSRRLVKGFARFTFEDGAEVILQAPAEVVLEDTGQVFLKSGTLTGIVPKRAVGFVVRTSGATVVDYGTEFGVTAHSSGLTETHVFDGKVGLRTGSDPVRIGQSIILTTGQASVVDEAGNLLAGVMKANPKRFVRKMPARMSVGQPGYRLNLADIVGGGNGFGTGALEQTIDPLTGDLLSKPLYANVKGNNEYVEVPGLAFVDGIFVPDGEAGFPQISSAGHLFLECPDTSGMFWMGAANSGKVAIDDEQKLIHQARLRGRTYGTMGSSAIFMHTNLGITFDLDTIRASIPGSRINSFRTTCAVADVRARFIDANFWVLLDGTLKYYASVKDSLRNPFINIKIEEDNRFLTIITTDGDMQIGADWCLFAEPVLELAPEQER